MSFFQASRHTQHHPKVIASTSVIGAQTKSFSIAQLCRFQLSIGIVLTALSNFLFTAVNEFYF